MPPKKGQTPPTRPVHVHGHVNHVNGGKDTYVRPHVRHIPK